MHVDNRKLHPRDIPGNVYELAFLMKNRKVLGEQVVRLQCRIPLEIFRVAADVCETDALAVTGDVCNATDPRPGDFPVIRCE